jgi:hypothetical protein
MAEHGTVARYKKHIRNRDKPCPECTEANRLERRAYYDNQDGVAKYRKTLYSRQSSRAFVRLKNMFPVEWYAIMKEEGARIEEEERAKRANVELGGHESSGERIQLPEDS